MNIWKGISLIGTESIEDRQLKRSIILVNQLALTWIPFTIIYGSVFIYLDLIRPAYLVFILGLVHVISLFFNMFKLFNVSRLVQGIVPSLIIFLIASCIFNTEDSTYKTSYYPLALSFLVFPFLYYSIREWFPLSLCTFLAISWVFIFPYTNPYLYIGTTHEFVHSQYYEYINFLLAAVITVIAFLYLKSINSSYLQKIEGLLDESRKKTDTIQKHKEEIEAQRDEVSRANESLMLQSRLVLEKNDELLQQNEEIAAQRDELDFHRGILEIKNQQIEDSIHYAKSIQRAVLPEETIIRSLVDDYFIFYKPKEIVSGDFYFASRINEYIVFAVADCTGHGVPGGFMSMMGIAFLTEIVNRKEIKEAGQVLDALRTEIITSLQTNKSEELQLMDGMDIAIVVFNTETGRIQTAGGNHPVYLMRKGNPETEIESFMVLSDKYKTLYKIQPDRMPVGGHINQQRNFKNNLFSYKPGDIFYLASDGFADQLGGPEGKRFYTRNLEKVIFQNAERTMTEQGIALERELDEWMKEGPASSRYEQLDDVLIVGLKI